MSTYAATIHVDDFLLGLGGRRLVHPTCSSATAEYEGLLYGLERLATILNEQPWERHPDIFVQGDCKTVIEQLQGLARPRKLEAYHQRAMQLLADHRISACFQHIPRGQNVLADELANCIAERYQANAVQRTLYSLGEFENGNCTHIESCLSELSKIDPAAQLAILRALARLCYSKRRNDDLLVVADKIRDCLKYNKESLYHVQDTLKLDAAVEAHVYQGIALSEGKQVETFRRKTKHFVRTHSEKIERIQKNLDQTLEWTAMECVLAKEISASESNQWSEPVQLWLDSSTDWVYC